ncbi:MAG: aldehyde dehydrogenase family protein, partial [Cellulomonadaceae bacterium]
MAIIGTGPRELLIDGAWVTGSAGTFDVTDPATAQPFAQVADASPADATAALDAAVAAGPPWRAVPPRERAELLRAVYDEVVARTEELAALMTAECGKPLAESRAEVAYGADYVRWYAEQAVRLDGGVRRTAAGTQVITRRPVGPALAITPWN